MVEKFEFKRKSKKRVVILGQKAKYLFENYLSRLPKNKQRGFLFCYSENNFFSNETFLNVFIDSKVWKFLKNNVNLSIKD